MPTYARDDPTTAKIVDRWDGGRSWRTHPDEPGQRTSHAIRDAEGGVWLFDPLDAPGVNDLYADCGPVVGVVVCSDYHARDADSFAARHDVSVHVPAWVDRGAAQIDAHVERHTDSIAGFELRQLTPLRAWQEAIAYRERDGTLYIPDFLSSSSRYTVGSERLSMNALSRLTPPRDTFADLHPDRILLGHGDGLFENAAPALRTAVDDARRRFPRALWNLPGELKAMLDALR